MKESLKQQTFKGIGWSAIERFSVQSVSFIVQLFLARLLTPDDFGIIGMLAIFIQISQVFIDSGFANALIQKQDCQEKDFSTVFYYNLIVSVVIYIFLYIASPLIADFYSTESIILVLRVLSLVLIVNALSIVQRTILVKNVDFKSQSKVTFISSLISGFFGISFALSGYGVWALVIQQLSNSIIQLVMYIIIVKWFPHFIISKESFKFVYNFGSKLLLASIINTLYKNLYSIVIGKNFNAYDLGLYTRSDTFAMFPSSNLATIITRATYPIMSKLQDDNIKLINCYKKLIQYSSFLIFPMMCGLIAVSKPFILVFLTDKWIKAVPLLQILSISWMFDHLCSINLNLLYVKGKTSLVLKLEVVKKTIAMIILFGTIAFGLKGMCWGLVLYSVIAVFINTFYTKKIFNYGWKQQFKDYIPFLLASIIMMCCVYITINVISSNIIQLVIGVIEGIVLYAVISLLFFVDQLIEIKSLIIKK